jgi:amino acid efflux transporter
LAGAGWHNEQLLLAELGTLAIVWWVGSRGASSSANLQTLVAVLIVALIAAIWWRGRYPRADPFPALTDVDHSQLFCAFGDVLVFVGLEAFAHLASEFKQPERFSPRADDWPAAGRHGLLGLYRAGAALQRLWR